MKSLIRMLSALIGCLENSPVATAADKALPADINIVTAIDVSGSIDPSTEGGFSDVVARAVIDTEETAVAVAQEPQRALGKARMGYSTGARKSTWRRGPSTDLSMANHVATDLLLTAPIPLARQVINIGANGKDNVAEGPASARARA